MRAFVCVLFCYVCFAPLRKKKANLPADSGARPRLLPTYYTQTRPETTATSQLRRTHHVGARTHARLPCVYAQGWCCVFCTKFPPFPTSCWPILRACACAQPTAPPPSHRAKTKKTFPPARSCLPACTSPGPQSLHFAFPLLIDMIEAHKEETLKQAASSSTLGKGRCVRGRQTTHRDSTAQHKHRQHKHTAQTHT